MMFNNVAGLKPKRHFFNKSFVYKTTMKMGELIPFVAEEVITGDKYKIGNNAVVRVSPMVAPILDNMYLRTEYFFVPDRLLAFENDFEKFYTGGKEGTYTTYPFGKFENVPGNPNIFDGSLSDYFGLPKNYKTLSGERDKVEISDKFHRAYIKVWNEFYRDENLQDEVSMANIDYYMEPLRRNWKKDYFTSALLDTQRGVAPAVPITGILPISGGNAPVIFGDRDSTLTGSELVGSGAHGFLRKFYTTPEGFGGYGTVGANSITNTASSSEYYSNQDMVKGDRVLFAERDFDSSAVKGRYLEADVSNSYVNLEESAGIGFTASQVRLLMQTQKWMERNMRAGVRYNEYLLAHFGFAPSDSTLQRPYFIGGNRSSLLVSEVLQTSQTTDDNPLGTLGGRGIGVSGSKIGTFVVSEPGIIIGLFSIIPKLTYGSQGINKKFSRKSKFDFYSPEFSHLSEQPIYKKELLYSSSTSNQIFGYSGVYDELRHNRDSVNGYFRQNNVVDLSYWHLARFFDYSPSLNSSFITCDPSKRIFQVADEPGFLVNFGNIIKTIRPLPVIAEPGLIDHF